MSALPVHPPPGHGCPHARDPVSCPWCQLRRAVVDLAEMAGPHWDAGDIFQSAEEEALGIVHMPSARRAYNDARRRLDAAVKVIEDNAAERL